MTRQRVRAPHQTTETARPDATLDIANADTPVMREYRGVKAEYPDAIVMARMGDFYELFGRDAEVAAPIIGVTLTGRGFGTAGRLPMCGVPHHAVTGYIRRLLESGNSVVLWDQVGEVISGKPVRREVTRVISPGTIVEADYLDDGATARCAAVARCADGIALAALDLAGGELVVGLVPGDINSAALAEECERLDIAELLLPDDLDPPSTVAPRALRRHLAASLFDATRAAERVAALREAGGGERLELDGDDPALGCVGAILAHCERARVPLSGSMVHVRRQERSAVMRLDPQTRRNLELLVPLGAGGTALVDLLDRTRTPMGARLLRQRLQEPLTEPLLINARLDAVAHLTDARGAQDALREHLRSVRDLERLVARAVQGIATPRDLAAVARAIHVLPAVAMTLAGVRAIELSQAAQDLDVETALADRIMAALVDEPPATAREGGVIRPGADAELDELLATSGDARAFIAGLEESERAATGIRSLKVGYNRVFGYYIEVPLTQSAGVPEHYVRKQTLVGAERYITADLKDQETIVLGARERSIARELEVVRGLTGDVAAAAEALLRAARAVAVIDVTQALADVAAEHSWVRPSVDSSSVIDIEGGRHPLVEATLAHGRFVANDCTLDAAERVVILTGPNMAGKSTFLRQVALVALLAQVGSFVPARRARIGVCDRIFTRIGAQDDLSAGLSTFMVEMSEAAAILRQATSRSLVILDEIGRGTSTYDGLSIAQAIVEHIHDAPHLGCRTLFATHYHELTALAERLPRVINARVEVVEDGETITFLHRIVAGGADRSYGIHVAKLAGLPASVVMRARGLLAEMETERPLVGRERGPDQMSFEIDTGVAHPVVDELSDLDLDDLTPLAALNKIAEWQARVQ